MGSGGQHERRTVQIQKYMSSGVKRKHGSKVNIALYDIGVCTNLKKYPVCKREPCNSLQTMVTQSSFTLGGEKIKEKKSA